MEEHQVLGKLESIAELIAQRVVEKLGKTQQWMDIHGAADYLGCSVATIERRIRSGEIPSVKVGRLRRLRRSDLELIPPAKSPPSESVS